MTILSFLIALSILVFIHELGHFLLAKRAGIRVDEFAIGFGPRLLGFKRGDTDYRLCLFPLGGYVKLKGHEPEDEGAGDADAYCQKRIWPRIKVILAGPFMNLLFCLLVMPIVFMIGRTVPAYLVQTPVIVEVVPDSPAESAGIKAGDQILAINGEKVSTWEEVLNRILMSEGEELSLDLEREGAFMTTTVQVASRGKGEGGKIGVVMQEAVEGVLPTTVQQLGFIDAIEEGFQEVKKLTLLTFDVLKRLLTFQLSYKVLGGPIAIAKTTGAAAASGLSHFLYFLCFLSLQLGILNLLPVPVLDGGHLVFLGYEAVRGKPAGRRVRQTTTQFGLALLLTLMLLVTINDAERSWGVSSFLQNFFSK